MVDLAAARRDPAEADVVALGARVEQACRREEAGERRDDGGADAELRGERGGVHRARAAVCDQGEVGGVAPLLGRHGSERTHHRGVCELVDPAGGIDGGEADGLPRPVTASSARSRETSRSPEASRPAGM